MAMCHSSARYLSLGKLAKGYAFMTNRWLDRSMSRGMGVSEKATMMMFGDNWEGNDRISVWPCAIDLEAFRPAVDRGEIRRALGLPADAFVVGHVGRFSIEKNHDFLIKLAHVLFKEQDDSWLLLVGGGTRRDEILNRVRELGIRKRVVLAGIREDVPRIMKGAMDVLVHPSLHEGLPLTVIEAQAAGLPVVVSEAVSAEADAVPELVSRISLSDPLWDWVRAIRTAGSGAKVSRSAAFKTLEQGPFNIANQVVELERLYLDALKEAKSGAGIQQ